MYFNQVTPPAISCFALPLAEYERRTDAAEAREAQLQAQYNNQGAYGREILWHSAFSAEYVALISNMPLTEIACWHYHLPTWCFDKRPLDLLDYCFLADSLREGLANSPTPLAALRLGRALAWVEQAGSDLLPTAQSHLTASQPEAALALAA